MGIGRNERCPCGSGRKYKVCCLPGAGRSVPAQAAAIRTIQCDLEPRLLAWFHREMGAKSIQPAWEDFTLRRFAIEPVGAEMDLFGPWLLYNWRTRPPRAGARRSRGDSGCSIAELYVRWHAEELSEAEKAFASAVMAEPFSFHDVLECEPGRRLRLRDVLRGTERDVLEMSGSQGPRPGDILFARTVPFEGVCLLIGSGSVVLPPLQKGTLLDLRRTLRKGLESIDAEVLHAVSDQLRATYFIIRDRILNPPPPKLCNTDGDPLLFHEIRYEIDSPDEAFRALQPLATGCTRKELLGEARLDGSGRVRRVEVPWLKPGNEMNPGWDNTILGRIRIEGRTMTVEVNSARRAKRIQTEIRRRLRSSAIHLETRITPADAAMRKGERAGEGVASKRRLRESEKLKQHPEAQARIRAMIEANWETWPIQPLPALGGLTPMEAVKDPDGREMVEALLADAEQREAERPLAGQPFDLSPVRRRLGLGRPTSL